MINEVIKSGGVNSKHVYLLLQTIKAEAVTFTVCAQKASFC